MPYRGATATKFYFPSKRKHPHRFACMQGFIMPPQDNTPTDNPKDNRPASPDAHGKAALLLVESLVHGLCEKTTLSTMDAVNITERAMSIEHERASESENEDPAMWQSYALLAAISASLRTDRGDDPFAPKLVP